MTTTMMVMATLAIVQTGPLSGDDAADLVIGILRVDQGQVRRQWWQGFVHHWQR
jgi:hypothetical protein